MSRVGVLVLVLLSVESIFGASNDNDVEDFKSEYEYQAREIGSRNLDFNRPKIR